MATNTFLFTDIESSTRLWEEHHDAMRSALEAHDALIGSIVTRHGGRVFKHTGDGAAAVFDSAAPALSAAIDIQKGLAAEGHPEIGPLRVRMGVHSGEADEREGDYFGPTLNRTARITAAAHGGQILVSLVAEALVDGDGFEFADLGEHRLHDLGRAEHIYQLLDPDLPHTFAPVRTLDHAPNNLPTQTTSFVGRDAELESLAGHIRSARLVTVTGVGGSGKTRLALQSAASLAAEFPDGIWLVELGAVTDPGKVAVALIESLGLDQPQETTPEEAALAYLGGRRSLIVIDNCEHLIDAAAELVDRVLSAAPGCKVLATSRELLAVPGEVAFGLRSMHLPGSADEVAHPEDFDGLVLFSDRAAAAAPGFRLGSDNLDVVVDICRRLDGMPLAIELAAARLRSFSPAKIAELLDQRFRLLTGGSRTALPRQQTLAATIDWSYRLLDEREQAVFRRLAVFQGGFTLSAVSAVCTDDSVGELDAIDLIPALVDKSLVVTDQGTDDRYRLLETIRQFAMDRMGESGEGEHLRERHAHFYRDLVVAAEDDIVGPDEVRTRALIKAEYDNLRKAVGWCLETGRGNPALDTAFGFARFSWVEGRWSEALTLVDSALAIADPPASPLEEADRLYRRSTLATSSPEADRAIADFERAESLLMSLIDAAEEDDHDALMLLGRTINARAIALFYQGEGGERNEHFSELEGLALDAARRAGDDYMVALVLANLAHHRDPFGDPEVAREQFTEAELLTREVGSLGRLAGLGSQRAYFEFSVGELEASLEAWDSALEFASRAGLETSRLEFTVARAIVELALGREDAVAELRRTIRQLAQVPDFLAGRQYGFLQTTLVASAAAGALQHRWDVVALISGASEVIEAEGTPVKWDLVPYWSSLVEAARAQLRDEFDDHADRGRSLERAGIIEYLASATPYDASIG